MSTTTASGRAQDSGYRAVLGSPYVARLLGGTLIGRLPTGMAPIAILLLVRAENGPLALAGALGALYGLACALGQPLLGRLVDRHGQTQVLVPATLAASTAFLLLPCTGPARHPVLAALTVLVAGLATPPLEAGLRALWPVLLPDAGRQRTALSLDSSTQGLVFVAVPCWPPASRPVPEQPPLWWRPRPSACSAPAWSSPPAPPAPGPRRSSPRLCTGRARCAFRAFGCCSPR